MNNQVRNTDLGEPLVVYVITCMTVHATFILQLLHKEWFHPLDYCLFLFHTWDKTDGGIKFLMLDFFLYIVKYQPWDEIWSFVISNIFSNFNYNTIVTMGQGYGYGV